jgi:hypothetical protein
MNKDEITEQIKTNTIRVAAKNLGVSYTNLRYWIKKLEITLPKIRRYTYCQLCGSELENKRNRGNEKKYCSNCKENRRNELQCYKYDPQKSLQKRLTRKAYIVKKLGGKCSVCGYDKNLAALDIHHVDPTIKEYRLDTCNLAKKSLSDIEQELSKCVVLCRNCHSEHHYKNYFNWKSFGNEWK